MASYLTTLENGQTRATVLFLGSPTDKKLPVDTGDIEKYRRIQSHLSLSLFQRGTRGASGQFFDLNGTEPWYQWEHQCYPNFFPFKMVTKGPAIVLLDDSVENKAKVNYFTT